MNIVNWVVENATTVLAIVGAVQVIAVAVVKLTPTPKDDAFLAKVLPWVEKLAGYLSVKAKTPKA